MRELDGLAKLPQVCDNENNRCYCLRKRDLQPSAPALAGTRQRRQISLQHWRRRASHVWLSACADGSSGTRGFMRMT